MQGYTLVLFADGSDTGFSCWFVSIRDDSEDRGETMNDRGVWHSGFYSVDLPVPCCCWVLYQEALGGADRSTVYISA